MPNLHTDDWLDARFDAAVDDLDRVLTAPRPLTCGEFRRSAHRHSAGRAALAVGVAGGTIGALALVARDSGAQAPASAPTSEATRTTVTSVVAASSRPTPQSEAWEAAVSVTLEAVGWPYPVESTVPSVGASGQVGGAAVTVAIDSGLLVFDVVPWATGEYSADADWQRGVAGVTSGGEAVAEGTLFVSDSPPNRSATIVTPLALVSVIAQQTDVDAIGGTDNFTDVARLLARAVPNVLAGEQIDRAFTPTASLDGLTPSGEYYTAVWDAREIVIGDCMTELGYGYRPRPNDAAGTGGTWDEWNEWHDQQVAADPDFEPAFQGGPDDQAGGCQLEAYLAVHGPGEEAYSKATTLENELRADIDWLDLNQTAVDQWVTDHAEDIDRVHAELDEELQTARSIIENANS